MSYALILYGEADPALVLQLQREIDQRREELARQELAIGDLRDSLLSFEGRYIRQVGILYKQLDEWNTKRQELHGSVQEDADEDFAAQPEVETPTAAELRQLFREVAKRIHPDHAIDDADAERRTRLMAQANDALGRWDRATLLRMLHGHDTAHHPVERVRRSTQHLERELAALREDLAAAEAEWRALAESELSQLREGVLAAAREGRDLLAEMAIRVQGLIGIAMRQYELDLDRIRRPGRGLAVESLLSAETPPEPTLRYDSKARRWIR